MSRTPTPPSSPIPSKAKEDTVLLRLRYLHLLQLIYLLLVHLVHLLRLLYLQLLHLLHLLHLYLLYLYLLQHLRLLHLINLLHLHLLHPSTSSMLLNTGQRFGSFEKTKTNVKVFVLNIKKTIYFKWKWMEEKFFGVEYSFDLRFFFQLYIFFDIRGIIFFGWRFDIFRFKSYILKFQIWRRGRVGALRLTAERRIAASVLIFKDSDFLVQ